MEVLALIAIAIMTGIGWTAARVFLTKIIPAENRIYFSPALGAAICGIVGYGAVRIHKPWLISIFCLIAAVCAIRSHTKFRSLRSVSPEASSLVRFTLLTVLCLYGMQIALYGLFSRIYPGPLEVWTLFNLTGTPPPDQMFAWHQAMFASQHRHYPQDTFFTDMDLYDRTQLGGFVTLFFFKLFHLPLTEDHLAYPPTALRFYRCFWWLLNNLYLLGVAPLFKHLFGYRGAVIGVASTALGGFFLLCNTGEWMKFSSAYPCLLAFLLFLEGEGPVLQAILCATSYYLHGSVIPFLAGFGVLQILSLRFPIGRRRASVREVAWFAAIGAALVGAWFVNVKWVGSKQPLFYYYIYGAGLTEAQTHPVAEMAKAFYASHTWQSLTFLPLHSLFASIEPVMLWRFLQAWFWSNEPARVSDVASVIFASQRFCIECAIGMVAAPVVIIGFLKTLTRNHSGKVVFCLYLIPSLIVALVYRREWAFQLHILCLYHTLVLFLWVSILRVARSRHVLIGLTMIALEGIICVLFADDRFLPVHGLRLNQMAPIQFTWLGAYFGLIVVIVAAAYKELDRFPQSEGSFLVAPSNLSIPSGILTTGRKLLLGVLIIALVVAIYSLYCLHFYPRG